MAGRTTVLVCRGAVMTLESTCLAIRYGAKPVRIRTTFIFITWHRGNTRVFFAHVNLYI